MASGVTVATVVTETFLAMKMGKKDDSRIRLATFGFSEDQIVVDKKVLQKDLNGENPFAYLRREFFKENKCCYVLYDCHYETTETPKDELVFVMWCPDCGNMKERMKYASSKDALTKTLHGVKHKMELHDQSDIDCFTSKLGTEVTKLEDGCAHSN